MQRTEEVKLGGAAMSLTADLSCLQSGGGAEREAALASLEKQLICPICLEIFNKPVVILPCQHNLCRKCANELYQPSLFQPRTTMMLNSGRFRCPSCRHDVVLDRHGVYGLQRNLLVENIIDVYKQEVSNNTTSSPLPPPTPLPAQVTCSDHEGEKVNIYCLTCQVPTCSLCKVFGAHQSCQVAPLTDVFQQKKDELTEGVSLLVAFNEKIQALIDELDETCRNIEENSKTQKQIVCEKFDHMFSVLEERRKVMTQQISSEEEEKTGHTQALVRCYGDSIEANKKLMESAASSMEDPDMAAFVQSSRDMITKVMAANTSCPSETLKPGYENLSRYSFNFSQQERALRSIDFIKVVEDVPEEPEVHLEPEEPKEPLIQNIQPKQYQETSIQNLESVVEPVKELVPVLITPPVEPVQIGAPAPDLGLVRYSEEPTGDLMLLETEDRDSSEDRSGQMKVEKEEVMERCATLDPGKEGNVCPNQDGMSTQQYEGGEAGRRDVPEIHMKEEMEAAFYPSWYKTGSWTRVSPDLCAAEDTLTQDYEPTEDPLPVAKPELEARGAGRATSKPQVQIQDSQLLSEGQAEPPANRPELFPDLQPQQLLPLSTQLHAKPYLPLPQPPHHSENQTPPPSPSQEMQDSVFTVETASEDGVFEEESEEEEDMQGWVCVPGAVGKSFNLAEEICPCLEGGISESDKENFELSGADKKEQVEDTVDSKERRSGESDFKPGEEKETSGCDEISEASGSELSGFRKDAEAEERNNNLDVEDDDRTNNLILGDRDVDLTPGSSGFTEIRRDDDENSDKPEDFNPNMETSETEEKITSSVSLQIVTLLFYLLAFLVILQRVWAYIGCFICT